jgi:hypothetical protein
MSQSAHRDLVALRKTASTSKVFNLAMLAERHADSEDHKARPLFRSRALNTAIIVKHRLRPHERRDLKSQRLSATKVILPFDAQNLKIGGQVFFVGEPNQETLLRESVGISAEDLASDLPLLAKLDQLPSFDPFLLREQLRRNGYAPAPSYFEISPKDLSDMMAFVTDEIRQLVSLALGTKGTGEADPANKLAEALLSSHIDERLEPLRVILGLEGDAFRESVFAWKGFLYYKWVCRGLVADIARVVSEISHLRITGPRDIPSMNYLAAAQENVKKSLRVELSAIRDALDQYDRLFNEMVDNAKPAVFRELLVSAPARFLQLGERIGSVSHVASFWRTRFPTIGHLAAPIDEAVDIIQDFETSVGAKTPL